MISLVIITRKTLNDFNMYHSTNNNFSEIMFIVYLVNNINMLNNH